MADSKVLPPGEGSTDPYIKDIDAVASALSSVFAHLVWIEEHRASFEAARVSDPEHAERELEYLAQSTAAAQKFILRLIELIMSGYSIDPSKRLPKDMVNWRELVARHGERLAIRDGKADT